MEGMNTNHVMLFHNNERRPETPKGIRAYDCPPFRLALKDLLNRLDATGRGLPHCSQPSGALGFD